MDQRNKQEKEFDEFLSGLNGKTTDDLEKGLVSNDGLMLREISEGIRSIRYGSILLVVHDGRLVEVTKTVRIRTARNIQKEKV